MTTLTFFSLDDPTAVRRPLGALPFFVAYLVPASALIGIWRGGAWAWSTAILVFVITPLLDLALGHNRAALRNEPQGPPPRRDLVFDTALWAWVPLQLAILAWAMMRPQATALAAAGITLSIGLSTGSGAINVAHELMHRRGRIERALAEILMLTACYPHFCIEHVRGHHRTVATAGDPASAPFGQSIFGFLRQTLAGSVVSAWQIETARVRSEGARGLADRRVRYPLEMLAIIGVILALFGWPAVLFFVVQAAIGVLLLEIINYIEHYGLERRTLENGRWERVGPQHSWNASQRLTNWYLFNLQRHADHHEYATRPYWLLRHVDGSPQMPFGYATMSLMALVPPLWRRVMDGRVPGARG